MVQNFLDYFRQMLQFFLGLAFSTSFFLIPQTFSIGFKSRELTGQLETHQWHEGSQCEVDFE